MNNDVRIVHLAIDPQDYFLAALSPERRKSYLADLRIFADAIYPVPTIWIGLNRLPNVYKTSSMPGYDDLIESLELKSVGIKNHEDVFSKHSDDALVTDNWRGGDKLIVKLRKKYPNLETVIVTGLNTEYCVAETIYSTKNLGLKCWAIYDLMADINNCSQETEPEWHKKRLLELGIGKADTILTKRSTIEVIDKKTCLSRLGKQLAPDLTSVTNTSQKPGLARLDA